MMSIFSVFIQKSLAVCEHIRTFASVFRDREPKKRQETKRERKIYIKVKRFLGLKSSKIMIIFNYVVLKLASAVKHEAAHLVRR